MKSKTDTHFVFVEHPEHERRELRRITLREKLSVYFYKSLVKNKNKRYFKNGNYGKSIHVYMTKTHGTIMGSNPSFIELTHSSNHSEFETTF